MSAQPTPSGQVPASARIGVRAKILFAVALASLVSLVVGGMGISELGASDRRAHAIYADNVQGLDTAAKMRRLTVQMRLDVANHALTTSADRMLQYEDALEATRAELDETVTAYNASGLGEVRKAAMADLQAALDAYTAVVDDELLPLSRRNDLDAWSTVRDAEAQPHIDAMVTALTAIVDFERTAAKESAAAAHASYLRSRLVIVAILLVGLAGAVVVGAVVAGRILAGLKRVQHVADGLETGDLTRSADLTTGDEVGQTARALDAALVQLRGLVRTIDAASGQVEDAAGRMSTISSRIAAGAEETSTQAGAVALAAEVVSSNVQTVAAGSEEMGASIREISTNTNDAAHVAAEAVRVAETTNATITTLGDSSREIGAVVKVITAIAEQTNLLALNATIEAARAGDAGKGFAVVAGEVKELAQQTARATEDISARVQSIQGDSAGAVHAIEEISAIIARINDFQLTISSAVEEQTATTSEMNRNVAAAASSSGDIAANIAGVAQSAAGTAQAVTESQRASGDLTRTSAELSELVSRFRF